MPNTLIETTSSQRNITNVPNLAELELLITAALTTWSADPTPIEFAPYVQDGHFALLDYLKDANFPVEDVSYRDSVVSRALNLWMLNSTSPEFAPYIHGGQFYLADYMRGLGLVTPGTTRADLTYYNDYNVSWSNVTINNADFSKGLLLTTTKQIDSLYMTDVIAEQMIINVSSITNSKFDMLQYVSAFTLSDSQFTNCIFSNVRRSSPPDFSDDSMDYHHWSSYAIVPPTSSLLMSQNTDFASCHFVNFPLSDLFWTANSFNDCIFDTASATFAEGAGQLVSSPYYTVNGVQKLQTGLVLSGIFPDNMPCQNASGTLIFKDNTTVRGANFTGSTIQLINGQNLANVDLSYTNFTGTTVIYGIQTYQGDAIKALFIQLGMSASMANTLTILNTADQVYVMYRALTNWFIKPVASEFAPYIENGQFALIDYMTDQGFTSEDETDRNNVVTRALSTWFQDPTSQEFGPYVINGQFYLGDYMRSLGLVTPGTTYADLTGYELHANTVTPLNNVVINHADLQGGGFYADVGIQVNNMVFTDVLVDNTIFVTASNASIINSTFDQLQYNLLNFQGMNCTNCTFSRSIRFTPPSFEGVSSVLVEPFINDSNNKASPSSSVFLTNKSYFTHCNFEAFPLNDLYCNIVVFNGCTFDTESANFTEGAGTLIEPCLNNSPLTLQTGLALSGIFPDNIPFINMRAALVFQPGTKLSGANFADATILLSYYQDLSDVDLTYANFNNSFVYHNGGAYHGEAIRSLFVSMGMSQQMADTLTIDGFNPSLNAVSSKPSTDKSESTDNILDSANKKNKNEGAVKLSDKSSRLFSSAEVPTDKSDNKKQEEKTIEAKAKRSDKSEENDENNNNDNKKDHGPKR